MTKYSFSRFLSIRNIFGRYVRASLNAPVTSTFVSSLTRGWCVDLRDCGMFSNVNEVIERARIYESDRRKFFVKWRSSPYYDSNRGENVWDYYFEQPFSHIQYNWFMPKLIDASILANYNDNIIAHHVNGELSSTSKRVLANRLVNRYIYLKPAIWKKINKVWNSWNCNDVIGVHIRGRAFAQRHGGCLTSMLDNDYFYKYYFMKITSLLSQKKSRKVLICSDSQDVIDAAKKEYGRKLLTYNACRSKFGEMHHDRVENSGMKFDVYQLGEDVIIEAYLLSFCNVFIHGRSSVSNFVLANNPYSKSINIYELLSAKLPALRL